MDDLGSHFDDSKHAQRNLLDVPIVRELAVSKPLKQLAATVLGNECFVVRGIFFNKTPNTNWKVVWHPYKTIAVRERKEVSDFGPWSVKQGVHHVQPPAAVMSGLIAIRLHLDESGENNGPLRVIPGSHLGGYLSGSEIDALARDVQRHLHCSKGRGNIDAATLASCVVIIFNSPAASGAPSGVRSL